MKKTNRKGFTIVELVIVIAVIAILAAVLIPTFSSLIKKANTSNDIILVKNLNTIITTEEVLNDKNQYVDEAVECALNNGYYIDNLTPTNTDNEIIWDETIGKFALISLNEDDTINWIHADKNHTENKAEMWIMTDKYFEDEKTSGFAYYFKDGCSIPYSATGTLEIGSSVSLGKNMGIKNVIFDTDEAKNITICTNNVVCNVTIDAPNSVVKHYGTAGNIDIIAVANSSYHEYGHVGGIMSLTFGKVEVESTGSINILIAEPTAAADITINVKGGKVKEVYAKDGELASTLTSVTGLTVETKTVEEITELQESECLVGNDYKTFSEAISDLAAGENTIKLFKDVDCSNLSVVVAGGKSLTLDLNGCSLSYTKELTSGYSSVIHVCNGGELTIIDNSGHGSIKANVTCDSYNALAVIWNEGTLVLDSGTIELEPQNNAWGYAVDVRPNSWGASGELQATFTMNGGTLISHGEDAVRVAYNSGIVNQLAIPTFTMNGGTILGYSAAFIQQLEDLLDRLEVNLNAGTINTTACVFRFYKESAGYNLREGATNPVSTVTVSNNVKIEGSKNDINKNCDSTFEVKLSATLNRIDK